MDATVEPGAFAACPTCHVVDATMTNGQLAVGGYWRCQRCGQQWDQRRLATVAAYNAWDAARTRTADKVRAAGSLSANVPS